MTATSSVYSLYGSYIMLNLFFFFFLSQLLQWAEPVMMPSFILSGPSCCYRRGFATNFASLPLLFFLVVVVLYVKSAHKRMVRNSENYLINLLLTCTKLKCKLVCYFPVLLPNSNQILKYDKLDSKNNNHVQGISVYTQGRTFSH